MAAQHVRFRSAADRCIATIDVRFLSDSRHEQRTG